MDTDATTSHFENGQSITVAAPWGSTLRWSLAGAAWAKRGLPLAPPDGSRWTSVIDNHGVAHLPGGGCLISGVNRRLTAATFTRPCERCTQSSSRYWFDSTPIPPRLLVWVAVGAALHKSDELLVRWRTTAAPDRAVSAHVELCDIGRQVRDLRFLKQVGALAFPHPSMRQAHAACTRSLDETIAELIELAEHDRYAHGRAHNRALGEQQARCAALRWLAHDESDDPMVSCVKDYLRRCRREYDLVQLGEYNDEFVELAVAATPSGGARAVTFCSDPYRPRVEEDHGNVHVTTGVRGITPLDATLLFAETLTIRPLTVIADASWAMTWSESGVAVDLGPVCEDDVVAARAGDGPIPVAAQLAAGGVDPDDVTLLEVARGILA